MKSKGMGSNADNGIFRPTASLRSPAPYKNYVLGIDGDNILCVR